MENDTQIETRPDPVDSKPPEKPRMHGWLDEPSSDPDLFDLRVKDERRRSGLPLEIQHVDWSGRAMWVCFSIAVVSGIVLLGGYRLTTSGAFTSAVYIQTEFTAGWWFRGHSFFFYLL